MKRDAEISRNEAEISRKEAEISIKKRQSYEMSEMRVRQEATKY